MTKIKIGVQHLPHATGLELPFYATDEAAGMDIIAAISDPVTLAPTEYMMIETGLTIALPAGYEAQIRPRSGLAAKHGVTVLNSPGTIDSDYRGEVKIILINHGQKDFIIKRGDRIAQMVIAPVTQGQWVEMDALRETMRKTKRGAGGFGSTGTTSEAPTSSTREKP